MKADPLREKQRLSAYKVIVKAADLSHEESEIRIRRAFDLLFDEILRRRSESGRKGRRRKTS